ncbi:hypothetical protein ONE63_008124 [Megalurothrips usitatus]|uniref:Cytochrome P450 4C1-like n=1 Tax=Megalurothrips usitatus TaxID=439358 RepID=A0AAV7XS16_9NEOP|nr:hypothetical protein ONE63_008124 [Megalurothrips usitatus]
MLVSAAVLAALLVVVTARFVSAYLRFRRVELALPGPRTWPIIGNTLDVLFLKNPVEIFFKLWGGRKEFFRAYSSLNLLVALATDPVDLQALVTSKYFLDKARLAYSFVRPVVGNGLIVLGGAVWRAHRRALEPAFRSRVLETFMSELNKQSHHYLRRVVPGVDVDPLDNIWRRSCWSFMTNMLTKNTDPHYEETVHKAKSCIHDGTGEFVTRIKNPLLWLGFIYNATATAKKARCSRHDFQGAIRDIITRKRRELQERASWNEGDPSGTKSVLDILLADKEKSHQMTDEEILGEVQTFFFAAVDTTANTLATLVKILSLRADIQELLHAEVTSVFDRTRTEVTLEDLRRMEYTERVIKETMRLYPAVPIVGRDVNEDTEFAGYELPSGTSVAINIFGAHRDPDHWPDPLVFDPERFLPERSAGRHPCAYIPFSAGPRICIGARYAMMDMKVFVAHLVRAFRIDPADDGIKDVSNFPLDFKLTIGVAGAKVIFSPRT